ncbi:MAG: class I SAM-dependent methyltransferase [Desulfobacterales bacterium]|nr:class I SAM-dependent methyltransferase [Desulfobacterales bacterium]
MIPQSLSRFIPKHRQLVLNKFIRILKQEMIPLEIIDPGGRTWATAAKGIRHRLMIRDQRFFNALISPDAFSLGEAYIKGYFDVTGNIRDLYEMVCHKLLSTDQPQQPQRISAFLSGLAERFFAGSFPRIRKREKENIEYHYDIPGEFYRLFLGKTMGYTCGYYAGAETSMSEAQNEKMDIICRKLRLKPDDHLLDIGCGWGNFAVYAARHYKVRVTGITLSSEQKSYADQWVAEEGLAGRVSIEILNYRDLDGRTFDKISCVGMSEHVGQANMRSFYKIIYRSLAPDGLFLQHTITTNVLRKKGHNNKFLDTYMFPGGELMFQQDLIDQACHTGFELLNAENFRPHYVKTLADWIARMENKREKLLAIVPESIFRIYHVFFIGSLISFREKEIALFQNLFHKSGPDTRETKYFKTPFSRHERSII